MSEKKGEKQEEFFHLPTQDEIVSSNKTSDVNSQRLDNADEDSVSKAGAKMTDLGQVTSEAVSDSAEDNSGEPISLQSLGVKFVEQNSLERSVAEQADKVMAEKDVELEQKRLDKALKKLKKLEGEVDRLRTKIDFGTGRISQKEALRRRVEKMESSDILQASTDVKEITERLKRAQSIVKDEKNIITESDESTVENTALSSGQKSRRLPDETQQEYLMRIGKITAFGSKNGFIEEVGDEEDENLASSHQNLKRPGLESLEMETAQEENRTQENDDSGKILGKRKRRKVIPIDDDEEYVEPSEDGELANGSDDDDDDYYTEENVEESDIDDVDVSAPAKKKTPEEEFKNIDDGDEKLYQRRVKEWINTRSRLRALKRPNYINDPDKPEWEKPHPTANDGILNDEFRIPGDIYPSLFDYQKTGVQWLWELYSQKTGGIIGDEMGLGKTIQVIAFLAGLQYSGKLKKPVLVVCPATVLRQWCNEFHRWWPAFRVMILHSIGTGMSGMSKKRRSQLRDEENWEDDLDLEEHQSRRSAHSIMNEQNARELVHRAVSKGHVIITTYVGVRIYAKYLLPVHWQYAVLDEGHKIRNPDSYITLTCKQIRTSNRIILSGTPIQNNLVELWSLFDFIFPGRLGTLPVFQKQFCIPINLGGYANATNVQVQAGYKCAVILKDLISPYLLRRVKADVAQDLPKKSEMVLFCNLTKRQRVLYQSFLHSEDIERILKGKRNALYGIDILRKICNHPDLIEGKIIDGKRETGTKDRKKESSKTLAEKSGKMQVVSKLLQLWQKENRKALIFTQTRQMLNIMEHYMKVLNRETNNTFGYLRMDGTTPIGERQKLVDSFNTDPKYQVFLLTTRVGGLGVNLTGASRVIIYDPDWNPSTDIQARERAWRLGQKKDVTIYRLMIAGTIEEKIYHRQIFKQFLTNKVLKDPKQKRFFKMTDMYDLFTLGDQDTKGTDTADLFGARETNYSGTKERKSKYLSGVNGRRRASSPDDISEDNGDSDDFMKVSKMRGVASIQKYDTGEGSKSKGNDDDSRLVSQIFKASGVHSAIQHDAVLNSGGEGSNTVNTIEREAERIAKDAVNALRESRKAARKSGVAVPTWTGRHGAAGRMARKPLMNTRKKIPGAVQGLHIHRGRSGLSSASLLQSMKKRQSSSGTLKRIVKAPQKGISSSSNKNTEKLIYNLSSYMSGLDGCFSTSSDILDHLNVDISNEKDVRVLRSMLRTICKWDKGRKGWVLGKEFR